MVNSMKLTKIEHVEDFLAAVKASKGEVKLISPYGDVYNLKSVLSSFVAIGQLLGEHGDELELFCSNSADEGNFYDFFSKNPEVL